METFKKPRILRVWEKKYINEETLSRTPSTNQNVDWLRLFLGLVEIKVQKVSNK